MKALLLQGLVDGLFLITIAAITLGYNWGLVGDVAVLGLAIALIQDEVGNAT